MQNTYQDLITEIQNKNPQISGKLEGGKKFKLVSNFKPAGDQPRAIKKLVESANKGEFNQVLLGVTGSGKTFTMAKLIEQTNRPALIALIAAFLMLSGVSKSGSPAPKPITSFPVAFSSLAFWVTAIVGDDFILFKLSDIMLIEKY